MYHNNFSFHVTMKLSLSIGYDFGIELLGLNERFASLYLVKPNIVPCFWKPGLPIARSYFFREDVKFRFRHTISVILEHISKGSWEEQQNVFQGKAINKSSRPFQLVQLKWLVVRVGWVSYRVHFMRKVTVIITWSGHPSGSEMKNFKARDKFWRLSLRSFWSG